MKKVLIIPLLFCLSACFWTRHKFTSGREGQPLPAFNLVLADSVTTFNTASIAAGRPFLLFLFQPYCPYCRGQLKDMLKNSADFKNIPIYMITSYPFTQMRQFSNLFHLKKYPNITLARDSANQLLDYFKAPGVPYLAFYDGNRRLKEIAIGKEDISTVKDIVSN